MTQFGKMLREERKERKMLLGDLARRLKISVPYLSQIETGRRPAKETLVKRVINELGMSATEGNALLRAAAQSMTEFNIRLRRNASADDRHLAQRLAFGYARMSVDQKARLRALVEETENG